MALNYIPAVPSTIGGMNANALKMVAYNTKLAQESELNDVFNYLQADVVPDPNGAEIPEAIFLKIKQKARGFNTMKMGLLMDLQSAPRLGNAEHILGNEENLRMKHITLYHNEVKKGVASLGWGVDYNDLEPYQVYAKIHPKMVRFFGELRGRRCREGLLLTIAYELTKAPRSQVQQFNPNIFIFNTLLENQVRWDVTALTVNAVGAWPTHDTLIGDFVERIADVLYEATNNGANPLYADLDSVQQLIALEYYCRVTLKMEPIMLDNQASYIFCLPTAQVKIRDPGSTNSFAALIKDMSGLGAIAKNIPNVIGRYGMLVFVTDDRSPTLTIGGTNGAWTLTPGFLNPGGNDGRNLSVWSNVSGSLNYVFDVGYVIGKAALAEWIVEDYKYATESTEYGKFNGKGAFGLSGIQLVRYDEDTPEDGITGGGDTFYQRSSCVVLMARTEIVTVL